MPDWLAKIIVAVLDALSGRQRAIGRQEADADAQAEQEKRIAAAKAARDNPPSPSASGVRDPWQRD